MDHSQGFCKCCDINSALGVAFYAIKMNGVLAGFWYYCFCPYRLRDYGASVSVSFFPSGEESLSLKQKKGLWKAFLKSWCFLVFVSTYLFGTAGSASALFPLS